MPTPPVFVVDASVVVRCLVPGPFYESCRTFLVRCGQIDARLIAPTCLYSEVANALYKLCMAPPSIGPLSLETATALFQTLPDFEIALVDRVLELPSGDIALAPQWVQMGDGTIRDYRLDIYTRAMALSYPSRRGSLFDMSYAALAEQAHTTMWTLDERFYNNARAIGLGFVMHPGIDALP